ncbi:50S ribosomal protein L19e [Candidatus Micrarchaeota archaeon]|nr:50S ribosomal protein L19e [Candidatus Micrarchaeota archaeon]
MAIHTVRRLAAKIWRSGESRVRIMDAKRAGEALTTEDVKQLIEEKVVILLPKQGVSRGKARIKQSRKKMGRGRGKGSRKGSKYAGISKKDRWIRKVRAQRRLLKSRQGKIPNAVYRSTYRMIKGNAFPDKKRLEDYLKKMAPIKGEKA